MNREVKKQALVVMLKLFDRFSMSSRQTKLNLYFSEMVGHLESVELLGLVLGKLGEYMRDW